MKTGLRIGIVLATSALFVGALASTSFAGQGKPKAGGSSPFKSTLGKKLFFDTTLSKPNGMSCATCHDPSTGFTFPDSNTNLQLGVAPGIVPGRFGNRAVPTAAYAALLPLGPPHFDDSLGAYAGGVFWDGRAADLIEQAEQPFLNPNEMNNLVHNIAAPQLVVQAVAKGPSAKLFQAVYGPQIFTHPTEEVYGDIADAIAAYEQSPEVSPFTSKYDAWVEGKAKLSDSEMRGLELITGSTTGRPGGPPHKFAQCVLCHGIPSDPTTGLDLFTNSCFANIGVPKNPNNPYYKMTDERSNPVGYNAAGAAFVDLGLGDFVYPSLNLPIGNMGAGSDGQGDYLAINGTFKAPTLRNVDKRPYPQFVKAYFHNGGFKDLKDVVHFYNTRNLTTCKGEVIDFTQPHPYARLKGKPLWPAPEFPSAISLQNPAGTLGTTAINMGDTSAQVGNLGLNDGDEADIVNFLKALSDGFFVRD